MREYRLNMSMWGISSDAYMELKYFCYQYDEKKREANALLGLRSTCHVVEHRGADGQVEGTVMPRGNATSNQVEDTVVKRLSLLEDCDLIDRVAGETDGGDWKEALIKHCCYKIGYEKLKCLLPPDAMRSHNRNAFFRAKREFFFRLHNERILKRNRN